MKAGEEHICRECDRGDCTECERVEQHEVERLMELINEHVPEQYVQKLLKALDEPRTSQPQRTPDKGYIDHWFGSKSEPHGWGAYIPRQLYEKHSKGYCTSKPDNTDTHVCIHFSGVNDVTRRDCVRALERFGVANADEPPGGK